MSNTTYPARNPDTSLAFLSPGSASQLEVYRYLAVATLGVSVTFSWKMCLRTDTQSRHIYRISSHMRECTINCSAYAVSRTQQWHIAPRCERLSEKCKQQCLMMFISFGTLFYIIGCVVFHSRSPTPYPRTVYLSQM